MKFQKKNRFSKIDFLVYLNQKIEKIFFEKYAPAKVLPIFVLSLYNKNSLF